MTDQLSISIITPTLNAAQYMNECLSSVASQGHPRLEHIIVDGGSSDATQAVVAASSARWIARPGLGQTAAINTGLQHAQGDIVAWLNADDLYLPGCLAFVDQGFADNPDIDVLYGDCQVIGPSGAQLWREQPGDYDFSRLLHRGNYLAQPAVFFRKRVFDKLGYLDESLNYAMDFEMWLRCRYENMRYVPRLLAAFRWHPDSKTALNNEANWREHLRVVRRYGGGWTPYMLYSFARARLTLARQRTFRVLTRV